MIDGRKLRRDVKKLIEKGWKIKVSFNKICGPTALKLLLSTEGFISPEIPSIL